MNVVAKKTLQAFWIEHPKAGSPLRAWFTIARKAEWKSPQDIKDLFRTADFLADNRVVFDIGGNNYRMVCRVSYTHKQVLVKFVGTHAEYEKINANEV